MPPWLGHRIIILINLGRALGAQGIPFRSSFGMQLALLVATISEYSPKDIKGYEKDIKGYIGYKRICGDILKLEVLQNQMVKI
jgi:hypothetical protein